MIHTLPFTEKVNLNYKQKVDVAINNFYHLLSTREWNYYVQMSLQINTCSDRNKHTFMKMLHPTLKQVYTLKLKNNYCTNVH